MCPIRHLAENKGEVKILLQEQHFPLAFRPRKTGSFLGDCQNMFRDIKKKQLSITTP